MTEPLLKVADLRGGIAGDVNNRVWSEVSKLLDECGVAAFARWIDYNCGLVSRKSDVGKDLLGAACE